MPFFIKIIVSLIICKQINTFQPTESVDENTDWSQATRSLIGTPTHPHHGRYRINLSNKLDTVYLVEG